MKIKEKKHAGKIAELSSDDSEAVERAIYEEASESGHSITSGRRKAFLDKALKGKDRISLGEDIRLSTFMKHEALKDEWKKWTWK